MEFCIGVLRLIFSEKWLGNWEEDGACVSIITGNDCGPGLRRQKRICRAGTNDSCTNEDEIRMVDCDLDECFTGKQN